ncbi:hypothetical protein GOBAR_AA01281 [Gossypium barbadense]|uniref:Inactive shikimate kinase like 1, chloroplastic n=1 Tax=Gossypium barbadense TaxID=3634 RepID=A0A2P5YUQ1_GOSBA|nr:hypothetical protein GOBAR_AA01281 [Gossypium barbadense]
MEMTTILHSSLTNPPFTAHLSPSKFPRSFSTPFRLRTSLSFSPSLPPKSFPTNCSVSDDTTSSANVASVDLSIALKMNNSVKSSLGMLLADLFRYYYFDSDALVSEAAGGESAAISLKESDEKGFRESETEVLKQLSSMGRLVVCAGDGAVQNSTNLALLRHGISIWIDVPLEMVAKGIIGNKSLLLSSEITISGSYSELIQKKATDVSADLRGTSIFLVVLSQLMALYEDMRRGYATADATVSLQKVAYQLGYEDMDAVTTEDITMEVLKEIERLTRVKKMMEAAARPF